MKTAALIGWWLAAFAAAAPEAGHTAWKWEQSVPIPSPGVVRLELPPATLDVAQASLADLRLLSPDGVESPWLLDNPIPKPAATREVEAPAIRIIEAAANIEATTQLEFATGTALPIEAVTLRTPAREFIKSVTVEASADGETWQIIATNEVIFRQPNGTERLRLELSSKPWRNLRLSVSDARSKPIPITGAGLALAVPDNLTTQTFPTVVMPRTSVGRTATHTIDLGHANIHLESVLLNISDPVFSRRYHLTEVATDAKGRKNAFHLASGMLYRVIGENGASTEQLSIPVNHRVATARLKLEIENGDSPGLTVNGAAARCFPTTLEFYAAKSGNWTLLAGNPQATPPRYDLGPLHAALAKAPGQHLLPGELRARDTYLKPEALPGIDPIGAAINLAPWTRRCAVGFSGTGALSIELQPTQLANSRDDLADLRLIQNGRQLPYLIESRSTVRTLECGISLLEADPERPAVSRWKVEQPVPGLRAAELILNSPTPVFTRSLFLKTDHPATTYPKRTGRTFRGTWTKTTASGDSTFHLGIAGVPLAETLTLETDNGDNPPIEISEARITYLAPVLAAKLVASDPVFLYYGNPRATAPSYDLNLVRQELLAAGKIEATLRDEELLRPENEGRSWGVTAGSPWLWAALALMVVVLLAVVAKLLPKTATDS
ncbi:MAG: DUF3999 domain-containing protein [Akkermansiaceae bacterium]|nr:DUF3999 domain-containing protein [Akkermansiaceae bacterium]MCF7731659.1 DUF3999 domain-containing protein [Akkermansiaceae bacterium]